VRIACEAGAGRVWGSEHYAVLPQFAAAVTDPGSNGPGRAAQDAAGKKPVSLASRVGIGRSAICGPLSLRSRVEPGAARTERRSRYAILARCCKLG
jgi:hypothetical protein